MSTLHCLHPKIVEEKMMELVPHLQTLVDQFPDGTYSIGGIMGRFARQEWTCWLITEGEDLNSEIKAVVGTTCFKDMKQNPTMQIIFCAGRDPNDIMATLEQFHETAAQNGLTKIEIIGRAGWTKALNKMGYDTSLRLYRKKIDPPLVDMTIEGNA